MTLAIITFLLGIVAACIMFAVAAFWTAGSEDSE